LLLIRVTVYYRYNGKEASVTLDSIVSDSAAVFYPRVDSVSPNGVEQGTNVTLTITGQGFSTSAAPTVLLTKANHSDITCTVTDHSLSTRIICTTGTLPSSGMIGSGETAYWNVKVINTDSMSSSLLNGIYVIQNSPFIYTMDPTGGVVGSWAKVSGQDFGVKRDANDKVTFQGSSGRIDVATYGDGTSGHTVWSNNIIWVTVPVGAITGNVMVLKGSLSSNTYLFTVGGATQPNITSVNNSEPGRSGASGDVGNTVRIAGTNFGAAGATSSVTFYNGRTVASTSCNLWTATLIEVVVPSGATTGNLYVTAGGVNSNNVTFSVPYSGP
jgi:hypothetical protein